MPGPPPDPAAVAAKAAADAAQAEAEAKSKHNEAIKWYVDVLVFPEPAANALYVEQTLTDLEILSTLPFANKEGPVKVTRSRYWPLTALSWRCFASSSLC